MSSISQTARLEGLGLGLRAKHYQDILSGETNPQWFEALTDNDMGDGGMPLRYLSRIAERFRPEFAPTGGRYPSISARAAAKTASNISGVSRPVFVL